MIETFADPVRQWAEDRPNAPALVTPSETWSWADLDARVEACAARLEADRVVVQAHTSPALVVLVLACWRSGRTLVPLSTRWPETSTEAALSRLGLHQIRDAENIARPADAERRAWPASGVECPLTIVHTSGSTGVPKPVLHTVGNHVWSARGVIDRMRLKSGHRWLLDLPLYHVGGLGVVVRCALAGAALAVPEPAMTTIDAVRQLHPTHASLVSTQLRRLLLDARGADLQSLQAVLLGGSAIPADLLDQAVRLGLPVATSYGMTEMTSTVTATAPGADRDTLSTAGPLLPHRGLRISQRGEIEVFGPTRFAGYATPSGFEPAPDWYQTGDLGHLDAHGRLVIVGRRDLQFISGGENVRPEAVEAALLDLAAVAEAVVVPIPDAEFGSRPVAFIRPSDGSAPNTAVLAAALRQRLAGFEVPVAFHDWHGAEGLKPDRPALRAEAERRAGRSDETAS